MKNFFVIIILFNSISCSEEYPNDNDRDQNMSDIIELPALRTNSSFNQPYRILKTTISDPAVFDQNYGNLEISIGYVLRYYFYTAIDLNSDKNELISMDRSTFTMPDTADSVELIRAAISEISDMSYGSQECYIDQINLFNDHINDLLMSSKKNESKSFVLQSLKKIKNFEGCNKKIMKFLIAELKKADDSTDFEPEEIQFLFEFED